MTQANEWILSCKADEHLTCNTTGRSLVQQQMVSLIPTMLIQNLVCSVCFFFFFLTNHCNDFRVQPISNWTVLFMSNILKSVYVKAKVCKLKYLLVSHLNIQREPKVGLFVNSSFNFHKTIQESAWIRVVLEWTTSKFIVNAN